jgi:hypothetical protein
MEPARPEKKGKRKPPTPTQKKALALEMRGACPNPACTSGIPLAASEVEYHHIDGDRTNGAFENLIALCRNCHGKAEAKLINEVDLKWWRRALVNRDHPRLGPETAADLARPVKRPRAKRLSFTATGNSGPVYQGEKITVASPAPVKIVRGPAPDSIGAHAAERSYIEYLRKAYIDCRRLEAKYDPRRKRHYKELENAFAKAVGCEPLDEPIGSFPVLWPRARAAVAATLGARKYRAGYEPHDWDEHRRRSSDYRVAR